MLKITLIAVALILSVNFLPNVFAQEIAANNDQQTISANNSNRGEAITVVYAGDDEFHQDVITWQPFDGRHYFSANVSSVKFSYMNSGKVFAEVKLDNCNSAFLSLPNKQIAFQCYDVNGNPIFEKAKIFHSK